MLWVHLFSLQPVDKNIGGKAKGVLIKNFEFLNDAFFKNIFTLPTKYAKSEQEFTKSVQNDKFLAKSVFFVQFTNFASLV